MLRMPFVPPELLPEPVNWTNLNCHCMFVAGCLQGTGCLNANLSENLGQWEQIQRCQFRNKTDRKYDLLDSHSFSLNLQSKHYDLQLKEVPRETPVVKYYKMTQLLGQIKARTCAGTKLECAKSNKMTQTVV